MTVNIMDTPAKMVPRFYPVERDTVERKDASFDLQAQFNSSFCSAQMEMDHAFKDSKNPHLKNRYASLSSVIDAIKGPLNRCGISFSQQVHGWRTFPQTDGVLVHVVELTTVLRHKNGFIDETPITVPVKPKGAIPDAQEIGSAVTYARRYALQALCGISAEDDDGESASAPVSTASQKVSDESQKMLTQMEDTYKKYLNNIACAPNMDALLLITEKLGSSLLSQEYKDKVHAALDTKRKSL